ncbi:MAG: DUF2339 domain-containing protein [Elusimicrobia bacterium]|nr:DUF2339 domain-containing protein [Elusimicrobiota bacterium]
MEETKKLALGDILAGISGSWLDAIRKGGAERLIGEKLLNYVGMLMIVLGGAFFLKYTHGLAGPAGKLSIGLASGLALVALGEFFNRRPDRAAFSLPLIGGGWILVYYTVFAAHYLSSSRLIASTGWELAALCVTAAGMIGHSLKTRSRLLTVFAFGMAYFVFALTHVGVQTLTVCAVLALAGACLVRPLDSPEIAAVNLAGFYLNYFPVFKGVIAAAGGQVAPTLDFWHSLAAAAVVHSAYALLTPTRREERPERWVDAALSFSAVLYAAVFYSQVRCLAPAPAAAGLLALAAVLTGLSVARGGSEAGTALAQVQAFLGAAVLALGIFDLPDLPQRAWGLALAPSLLGTIGLWLDRKAFEKYGLALLGLALAHGLLHQSISRELCAPLALSLGYLGLSAYAFAVLRADREDPSLTGLWAYGGLAALTLGAWTYLSPAAFVTALFTLAMLLEWGAAETGRTTLLDQALLIETAAGVFCFFIDYGANYPMLGVLTPPRLVTGSAVLCYVTAIFGREVPAGRFLGCEYSWWRSGQSWLMSAVAAYGFSLESHPKLRLPMMGASALALLGAGRSRLPQARPVAAGLRFQSYILLLAASAVGVWTYLILPPAGFAPESRAAAFVFWYTALSWLLPLVWQPWAQTAAERSEEVGGQRLFALLSMVLPVLYIAKVADGTRLTLDWTLLGSAYLVAGLVTRRRALRLPGLGLVGLCVAKALFVDLTGMQLPYRVLSYTVLGVLLVASSYLYVRLTGKEDSDEI